MKKELLISLLMTSPVAYASAIVDFPSAGSDQTGKWTPNGTTGSDVNIVVGDGINVPGNYATSISRKIVLPQGTYTFNLDGADNAKVSFSGEGVTTAEDGNGFNVASETEVTITISAVTPGEDFSFGEATLTLQFDFEKAVEDLRAALTAVGSYGEGNDSPTDTELPGMKSKYDAEYNAIVSKIDGIGKGSIDAYKDYLLYAPDAEKSLMSEISAFNEEVEKYNVRAAAEKAKFDVKTLAGEYLDELKPGDKDQTMVASMRDAYNKYEYVRLNAPGLSDLLTMYDNFVETLKNAIENPGDYKAEELTATYNSLTDKNVETSIQAVANKFRPYRDDAKAYDEKDGNEGNGVAQCQESIDIKNAYDKALAVITDEKLETLKDDDMAAIYKDLQDAALEDLEDKYKEVEDVFWVKDEAGNDVIEGAAKRLKDYKDAVEVNVAAISGIASGFTETVNGQEEAKTDVDAFVKEQNGVLATIESNTIVPDQFLADYASLLTAAKKAIADLAARADAGNEESDYRKHVLEFTEEDKAVVTDAIDAISTLTESFGDVSGLLTAVNDMKTYIDGKTEEINKKASDAKIDVEFDLWSKFTGNDEAIRGMISQLPANPTTEQVAEVNAAIDAAKTSADNLVGTLGSAIEKLSECNDAFDSFNTFIGTADKAGEKYTADATTRKTYLESKEYLDLKGVNDNLVDDLKSVAAAEGDACREMAGALVSTMDKFVVDVAVARLAYAHMASEANLEYAKVQLEKVTKLQDENPDVYGIDLADATGITVPSLDDITIEADADEAALKTIDEQIKTAIGSIDKALTEINARIANQKAYDELVASADEIGGTLEGDKKNSIATITDFNNSTSSDPAKTFYDEKINGSGEDSFKSRYDAIAGETDGKLITALHDYKADDDQTKLQGTIDTLRGDITALHEAIQANEDAHKKQVSESGVVRDAIEDAKTLVNSLDPNGYQAVSDKLDECSGELAKVDIDVAAAYGKGESAKLDEQGKDPYITRYKEINAAVTDALASISEYTETVVNGNQGLFDDNWTNGIYADLTPLYDEATYLLQRYTNGVRNAGYKNALSGIWDNHEDVRPYLDQILDLDKRANEVLSNANTTVVTPESGTMNVAKVLQIDDLQDLIDEATTLKGTVEDKIKAITDDVDEVALSYYAEQLARAQNVIEDAERKLSAAGVELETSSEDENGNVHVFASEISQAIGLHTAKTNLEWAQFMKQITEDTSSENPILLREFMDDSEKTKGISGLLDLIKAESIDLQLGAEMQWDVYYEVATDLLSGFRKDYEEGDLKPYATEEVLETLADTEEAVEKLNEEVAKFDGTADDKQLVDILPAKKEALDELMKHAVADHYDAQAAFDGNTTNTGLYNGYTETLKNIDAEYSALCDYVGALGANIDLGAVKAKIDAAGNLVEENYKNATLADVQADIDGAIKDAENAIADAFRDEAIAEVVALEGMIRELDAAANEANAEAVKLEGDERTAMLDKIAVLNADAAKFANGENNEAGETVAVGVTDLRAAVDADDFGGENAREEAEALKETFLAKEKEACDLLVAYKTLWTDSPVVDVVSGLDAYLAEVQAVLDEAVADLDKCNELKEMDNEAYTAFEGKYSDFATELGSFAEKWATADNTLYMQQGNLKAEMDAIKAGIEETAEAVGKAQAAALDAWKKKTANEARYQELNAEIETIRGHYESAKERVESYTYVNDEWDGYIEVLDNAIETLLQEQLDANYNGGLLVAKGDDGEYVSAYTLDKETVDGIYNIMYNMVLMSTNTEVNTSYGDAVSAMNAAHVVLSGTNGNKVLPEVLEVQSEEYNLLYEKLFSTDKDWTSLETVENEDVISWWQRAVSKADVAVEAYKDIIERANAITATADANTYLPGDLNNSGEVNIVDVQMLIDYIKTGSEPTDERERAAADMNGDGTYNVADLTLVISASRGEDRTMRLLARASMTPVAGDNIVAVERMGAVNGKTRFAVNIDNAADVTAGQLDLIAPAGMSIVNVEAAGRLGDHELATADNAHGMRVVIASMENTSIEGNTGAVLYVDVAGEGTLGVDTVIFADRTGSAYEFKKAPGTTGIDGIGADGHRTIKERIYNAAGQMMNRIQRGINIIRHSDGTTTKEYRN